MKYRRIIPFLLLSVIITGCNAPADPAALQHPIHQRIVNAQCVTLEIISVNGEQVPPISQQKAIETFRKYVAGEVRVVEGKPATVEPDKDGKITYKQIEEILKGRQHCSPSDITILYLPEIAKKEEWTAMYWYRPNTPEFRQCILYQTKPMKEAAKSSPVSEETNHQFVLLHELCHSLWVPCDRTRSWSNRHCTNSDCILYPASDTRFWGKALLRGKLPLDLCPACQAEIRQAQQAAKGKLIGPDEPYDFASYFNELVRLNPENLRAYTWRVRYHNVCKRYDLAIADLTRAIELDPNTFQYYMDRAAAYQIKGDTATAEKDMNEIAKRMGTNTYHLNSLAWVLATAYVKEYRNGNIAVEVATKACTLDNWKKSYLIDTLAAAYAEQGLFDKAIEYQTQAIEKDTKKEFAEGYQKRLELYREKKPYRTPNP